MAHWGKLTANISNAKDTNRARVNHATLVWQERDSARSWNGLGRHAAVWQVAARVAVVAWRLLLG